MKQNHIILIAASVMLILFTAASYLYNAQQNEQQAQHAAKNKSALSQFYSPKAGDPAAKVTLVEFMDPACETCAQFHPFIKQLMEKYKGKLNLVIRYAPFHHGSDYAVKILEAARKQGTYWGVLELMYESQATWASHHNPQPELLWKYLEHYKFDVPLLQQTMNDPSIISIINQDLADAKQLGVRKTPSFFVNGKPLLHFGYQQLEDLIASSIAEQYESK